MITISWSQFKFLCFCLLIRTYVTIMERQKYNWFILLHRILFIKKVTKIKKNSTKNNTHDEKHIICLCHILLNSSFSYHYGQACLIILTALLSLPGTLFVLHRFHLSREKLCPCFWAPFIFIPMLSSLLLCSSFALFSFSPLSYF